MTVPMILLPVFVQVALTLALMIWMAYERNRALRTKEVRVKDIALSRETWPERPKQVANAYHNQFELPVLFYVLVALALVTKKADLVFVVLSWIFVLSRLLHTYIHVTSNRISRRFLVFSVGLLVLAVMWVLFAIRVLTGA